MRDDAYHRGYVDVPSERVWDLPHIKRAIVTIYGPKSDGTYIVEFRSAAGEALATSIPRTEATVIRYFQARMPYGLVVHNR